jgi:tRNA dimethylallyltransferase
MTNSAQRCHGAIALMGPTASGKTALAMAMADCLPCEIISVDSAQVYRGMDIGTAKPDVDTLRRYPHALIDLLEPDQSYSVACFREDALDAMAAALAAGRIPLLVGGTMMYFKALLYGIDELPPADAGVRAQIEQQAQAEGWQAVHRRLVECDPICAARIGPGDRQRLQRALEVFLVSGRRLSDWQSSAGSVPAHKQLDRSFAADLPCPVVPLALAPLERSVLHQRIAARFQQMLAAGLVDEVRRLRQRGDLHAAMPSMRCVGYRQVWDYLGGDCQAGNPGRHAAGDLDGNYDYMVERGIIATRQLAKRQLTWLRSWRGLHWIWTDADGGEVRQPAQLAGLTPLSAAQQYLRNSLSISV